MKTEDFSNKTLRDELLYWETKQPSLKKHFQSESMIGLLEIIDKATYAIKDSKLITDFILGQVAWYFFKEEKNDKDRQYFEQQADVLTRPLMIVLKKHLESDYRDYIIDQEVTGEEIIKTDRVIVPITKNALRLHINKTKVFPMNTTDVEKLIKDFTEYKENFWAKLPILNNDNSDKENKTPHNLPLLSSKYDAKKVYDAFFKGELCLCALESFNDWFVNGYEADTITVIENGKKSVKTGKPTRQIAQLRKLIEKITENTENTKDAYFDEVFKIKLNNTQTAITLNSKYNTLLKNCML
jgi:hypothetical protein